MKKATIITGLLTIILSSLLAIGIISAEDEFQEIMNRAESLYVAGDYPVALKNYKKAAEMRPENKVLFFNCAQAAYNMSDYAQAVEFYLNAPDYLDKFINLGNSYIELGYILEDPALKLENFNNALEAYRNGILLYPDNIDVKYNYEYADRLLKQTNTMMLQTNKQDNEEDEQKEQDKDNNEDPTQQEQQEQQQQDNANQQEADISDAFSEDGSGVYDDEIQSDSVIERNLAYVEMQELEAFGNNREINSQAGEDSINGW